MRVDSNEPFLQPSLQILLRRANICCESAVGADLLHMQTQTPHTHLTEATFLSIVEDTNMILPVNVHVVVGI